MRRIRLGLLGSTGKMGGEVLQSIQDESFAKRIELVAAPKRGEDLRALLKAEAIVEFSSPTAVLELCQIISASAEKPVLVIGATGWTAEELKALADFGKKIRLLRASNFSVGVFIATTTLKLWHSFPELKDWKVQIREWHHAGKKDAPSGTALTLRSATGHDAPIESIREGKVIGTHEVVFESESESLTLVHHAKKRSVFADGALMTAIRLAETFRDPELAKKLPARELTLSDLYLRSEA